MRCSRQVQQQQQQQQHNNPKLRVPIRTHRLLWSQDICTTSWDPSCRRECICTNGHGDMRHMCTPCICRHSKQDPVRWSENLHKQKEAEVLDMLQAFLKSTSQPTRPHNRSMHAYIPILGGKFPTSRLQQCQMYTSQYLEMS